MISRREWLLAATAASRSRMAAQPTAAPLLLRAGGVTLEFEPELAFMRYLRLGDAEILRGIYSAVRDATWLTVLPRVTNIRADTRENGFRVTFDAACVEGPIDFVWQGVLTGSASGVIRFEMEGEARTSFRRNRIGFCVLHPLKECAGKAYRAETASSGTVEGIFPQEISPHQPVKDLRSIAHKIPPGVEVEVVFEGEIFEMEDHRNWTDGNFKTYCTPLERPWPVEVAKGTKIRQAVEVRLKGPLPSRELRSTPRVPRLEARGEPVPLPAIGLGWSPTPERSLAAIRQLDAAHLRVDLHLDSDWRPRWAAAAAEAKLIDAPVEMAVFARGEAGLEEVAKAAGATPVARWLVFHPETATTPPELLRAARKILAGGPVGGGTNIYFTELNRERPQPGSLETACYSINPQVHAFDDRSLVENLEPQGDTVRSARRFLGDSPLAVTPVTLRPRFNPQSKPWQYDTPQRFDPRQAKAFAAAWLLGSIKYLSEAGAQSITYFETEGPGGIVSDGQKTPAYAALADVLAFRDGELLPVSTSDPLRAVGLLLRAHGQRRLLVVNLTARKEDVEVAIAGFPSRVSLSAYGVARLNLRG